MSSSGSESEWIIDNNEKTVGYSYIRDHLSEQPKAKGGPPFSKSYVGYINTDKNILIVAGEVEKSDYPTKNFVLFGVDYWNIPSLPSQSVVPSWTYPIEGGIEDAKEAAKNLKILISETDTELTAVSENNDMRLSIFNPVKESRENSLSQYFTDYMISVQTERKHPETPWGCQECGKALRHESQNDVSYHILKSKNGYFYPYRYSCPDHPVSDVDELDYIVPSKDEAIDYHENLDLKSAEAARYGNLLISGIYPIEIECILRCDITPSQADVSNRFVSMVNTTITDRKER